MPDVEKDDLDIRLENGSLVIEASTEKSTSEEDGKVIRQERQLGRYMRSFYIGENISNEQIRAKFKNGILKLEFPKPEQVKPETKAPQKIVVD